MIQAEDLSVQAWGPNINCKHHMLIYDQVLGLASVAVPLSLVSFFASSLFFAAAICQAGIAARPPAVLPYGNVVCAFSSAGEGTLDEALFPCPLVALEPFGCSEGVELGVACGAGVDGAGVDGAGVPFNAGVGA
jgi:hypothetical protein